MESKLSFWVRCALAALAYGLAYAALREASLSGNSFINWIPVAGLRLICLLLLPTRYWPALMIGEAIPLGYENYQCLALFGLPWVVVASTPPMLYSAPIVYLMRKQLPGFEKCLSRNAGALLLCMFLLSLASALHGVLNYTLLKQLAPGEQPITLWVFGCRLVTSGYLSLLTITPVALWVASNVRRIVRQHRLRLKVLLSAAQDFHWKGTGALLAIIIALATAEQYVGEGMHYLALCGVLATLATAAWRYGWQSTAIVGAATNLSIVVMMPTRDDLITIQMQCLVAAVMSVLLLFGVRTSSEQLSEQRERASRRLARRELFAIERNRLAYACVLDDLFNNARQETMRLLQAARTTLPAAAIASHYRQFDDLHQEHQRLTAGMSPRAWWQFGGMDGPIVQTLAKLGVQCEIREASPDSGVFRLSTEMAIAVYRLSGEAVVYLMKQAPSDHLCLSMSIGHRAFHTLEVEVTLESVGEPIPRTGDPYEQLGYEQLQLSLGASGLNEQALRNRAQLYDGDLRVMQTSAHHLRMVLRVTDQAIA